VEDPSQFGGSLTNFDHVECATIAIRGAPTVDVTVNDLTSQADHNSIRSHVLNGAVFPTSTEADDYCDEVIARYKDDAPIIRIGYTANKDTAHRNEAHGLRLGHKITLEADNNAGMGINGDYIIESIRHRWSNGATLWTVSYELAEA